MSITKFIRGVDLTNQTLNVGLALQGIEDMAQLEWLRLDRAQLESIPAKLHSLARLKNLEISNNQITAIANEIGRLPSLERLRINGNAISTLSDGFFRSAHLHTLLLAHNQVLAQATFRIAPLAARSPALTL